jgi:hypothetical protein
VFRKVLPGMAASALGDGMSAVIGELSAPFLRRCFSLAEQDEPARTAF